MNPDDKPHGLPPETPKGTSPIHALIAFKNLGKQLKRAQERYDIADKADAILGAEYKGVQSNLSALKQYLASALRNVETLLE